MSDFWNTNAGFEQQLNPSGRVFAWVDLDYSTMDSSFNFGEAQEPCNAVSNAALDDAIGGMVWTDDLDMTGTGELDMTGTGELDMTGTGEPDIGHTGETQDAPEFSSPAPNDTSYSQIAPGEPEDALESPYVDPATVTYDQAAASALDTPIINPDTTSYAQVTNGEPEDAIQSHYVDPLTISYAQVGSGALESPQDTSDATLYARLVQAVTGEAQDTVECPIINSESPHYAQSVTGEPQDAHESSFPSTDTASYTQPGAGEPQDAPRSASGTPDSTPDSQGSPDDEWRPLAPGEKSPECTTIADMRMEMNISQSWHEQEMEWLKEQYKKEMDELKHTNKLLMDTIARLKANQAPRTPQATPKRGSKVNSPNTFNPPPVQQTPPHKRGLIETMWSPETSPEQRRAMVAGLQQPPLAPPPAYHQTSSPTAIITDNFQGSLIQAQTTNYAVPAGPKGKAKARSRAPAKPRATTTSASKVTKTKSKKSSAPAPAVVRSIEELYAAQFDSLSHEEKCRLMLPLLQGFNPLSPCPPPCTSPSPSPEGAEPSLPIARSGQDLAMVQQAIDELGPAALGGAMRQQEALQRTQTRRR